MAVAVPATNAHRNISTRRFILSAFLLYATTLGSLLHKDNTEYCFQTSSQGFHGISRNWLRFIHGSSNVASGKITLPSFNILIPASEKV